MKGSSMNIMQMTFNPKKHSMFTPVNIDKYKGGVVPFPSRSSWEWKFYQWCDMTPPVTNWAVEAVAIKYFDPTKRKNRLYYPDVIMSVKTDGGRDKIYLIEIKPYKEVLPPTVTPKKKESTLLREMTTYQTNMEKWKAAELYCKKKGWIFRILTEKDLFKEGKP